jgi:hypothetical protein
MRTSRRHERSVLPKNKPPWARKSAVGSARVLQKSQGRKSQKTKVARTSELSEPWKHRLPHEGW